MNQLEQLMQALQQQRAQQQAQMIQSQAAMIPMEQQWANANTRRFGGLIPGLIETAVDASKRKKLEPEYRSALEGAMSSAAGYDELNAQLAALQQQMAAEAELARKQQAAQSAGWGPASDAIALGMKTPPVPKETSLVQNLKAMGVDPNSPEGRKIIEQSLTKGQTAYNITIPTGYRPVDPTNPAAGFAVIPGSPQAQEQAVAQQERAEAEKESVMSRVTNREKLSGTLDEVRKAKDMVGLTTTGRIGREFADFGGTEATDLRAAITSIQSNLAFDKLMALKTDPANKTGGALGAVSEKELNLLMSTLTSLDPEQRPQTLRANLEKVERHFNNFLDALDGKMPAGYDEQGRWVGTGATDDPKSAYEAWKKQNGLK